MAFEVFRRPRVGRAKNASALPLVGVTGKDKFTLNGAAVDMMAGMVNTDRDSLYVSLLYDPEWRAVGFRPSAAASDNAYRVSRQSAPAVDTWLVHCGVFIRERKIEERLRSITLEKFADDIVGFRVIGRGARELR